MEEHEKKNVKMVKIRILGGKEDPAGRNTSAGRSGFQGNCADFHVGDK